MPGRLALYDVGLWTVGLPLQFVGILVFLVTGFLWGRRSRQSL